MYVSCKKTYSSLSEYWCKIKFEKKMQGISQQDMKNIDTIIYLNFIRNARLKSIRSFE